jgi:hypothetical protein
MKCVMPQMGQKVFTINALQGSKLHSLTPQLFQYQRQLQRLLMGSQLEFDPRQFL